MEPCVTDTTATTPPRYRAEMMRQGRRKKHGQYLTWSFSFQLSLHDLTGSKPTQDTQPSGHRTAVNVASVSVWRRCHLQAESKNVLAKALQENSGVVRSPLFLNYLSFQLWKMSFWQRYSHHLHALFSQTCLAPVLGVTVLPKKEKTLHFPQAAKVTFSLDGQLIPRVWQHSDYCLKLSVILVTPCASIMQMPWYRLKKLKPQIYCHMLNAVKTVFNDLSGFHYSRLCRMSIAYSGSIRNLHCPLHAPPPPTLFKILVSFMKKNLINSHSEK